MLSLNAVWQWHVQPAQNLQVIRRLRIGESLGDGHQSAKDVGNCLTWEVTTDYIGPGKDAVLVRQSHCKATASRFADQVEVLSPQTPGNFLMPKPYIVCRRCELRLGCGPKQDL